jgi:hypothetical protein
MALFWHFFGYPDDEISDNLVNRISPKRIAAGLTPQQQVLLRLV